MQFFGDLATAFSLVSANSPSFIAHGTSTQTRDRPPIRRWHPMDELNSRPTQATFLYLRDPLFWSASLLFALNRFLLKPRLGSHWPFLRNHFNDCFLIPAALPVLLWIFRKLKLRAHDAPPAWREVLEWTIIWSLAFEWAFPRFLHLGTSDWRDAFCYLTGAVFAGFWWNKTAASEASSSGLSH